MRSRTPPRTLALPGSATAKFPEVPWRTRVRGSQHVLVLLREGHEMSLRFADLNDFPGPSLEARVGAVSDVDGAGSQPTPFTPFRCVASSG